MLYAKVVRAYTHTLRLHMIGTLFLVHMYAFTYDVHDILVYTYVIHTWSHYMFITVWLFISLFIFQFFFLVYTNSIHSFGALQLFGISLEYDIWHMVAWILDISPNIHQVYLTYWWKFRHVTIIRMVLRGTRVLLYFNTIWLCPDVYPFSLHLFLVHTVHRMSTFSHGFSCIWDVYLCYTLLHKQVRSVYNMYTSSFYFLGCIYDH